jgi:hypothetical protein
MKTNPPPKEKFDRIEFCLRCRFCLELGTIRESGSICCLEWDFRINFWLASC